MGAGAHENTVAWNHRSIGARGTQERWNTGVAAHEITVSCKYRNMSTRGTQERRNAGTGSKGT